MPSSSVSVPCDLFSKKTEAPGKGLPSSSVTWPVILPVVPAETDVISVRCRMHNIRQTANDK
jgi:hypothetical protein